MPWCPNCKLEYVEGVKVCPDCKTALVDSLDDADSDDNFEFSDEYNAAEEQIEGALSQVFPDLSEEEREAMLENMKKGAMIPKYKSIQDSYGEHKSGAFSLILVGVLGVVFVVLNALKIISLPISGNTLTNVVMGALFLIFLVSGVLSGVKASKLKSAAKEEKDLITKILDYVKSQKSSGVYPTLNADADDFERYCC